MNSDHARLHLPLLTHWLRSPPQRCMPPASQRAGTALNATAPVRGTPHRPRDIAASAPGVRARPIQEWGKQLAALARRSNQPRNQPRGRQRFGLHNRRSSVGASAGARASAGGAGASAAWKQLLSHSAATDQSPPVSSDQLATPPQPADRVKPPEQLPLSIAMARIVQSVLPNEADCEKRSAAWPLSQAVKRRRLALPMQAGEAIEDDGVVDVVAHWVQSVAEQATGWSQADTLAHADGHLSASEPASVLPGNTRASAPPAPPAPAQGATDLPVPTAAAPAGAPPAPVDWKHQLHAIGAQVVAERRSAGGGAQPAPLVERRGKRSSARMGPLSVLLAQARRAHASAEALLAHMRARPGSVASCACARLPAVALPHPSSRVVARLLALHQVGLSVVRSAAETRRVRALCQVEHVAGAAVSMLRLGLVVEAWFPPSTPATALLLPGAVVRVFGPWYVTRRHVSALGHARC